jgi:hypothetical protein
VTTHKSHPVHHQPQLPSPVPSLPLLSIHNYCIYIRASALGRDDVALLSVESLLALRRQVLLRHTRYAPTKQTTIYLHVTILLLTVSAEENLLAIGAEVRRDTGSDVFKSDPQLNEWMQRVKKLGGAPDSPVDDDERARKFEEVSCPPPTPCKKTGV